MSDFTSIGKTIIVFGIVLILVGLGFMLVSKIPFLGKLPGDIVWKRGNFTVIFPLATSIIISLVLTLLLNLIFRR